MSQVHSAKLSLKRRPGSSGEPAERRIPCSALKLILTFSRAPMPSPSPSPNQYALRYRNSVSRSQFSAAAPSPPPGRCASAAALRTPPPFPSAPPHQPQARNAHARLLQRPFNPACFPSTNPFFEVHRAHAHSAAGPVSVRALLNTPLSSYT